jgi:hypothetical protein
MVTKEGNNRLTRKSAKIHLANVFPCIKNKMTVVIIVRRAD